jgi:hypothetical protein
MSRTRSYSELCLYHTFEERFDYLKLHGAVGNTTFGFDRWINQSFYHSYEWKNVRDYVIIRDGGCDLGIPGYELYANLLVHHMNPVSMDDIVHHVDWILDPNFLITVSLRTHNAIHYATESLPREPITRSLGDTTLW